MDNYGFDYECSTCQTTHDYKVPKNAIEYCWILGLKCKTCKSELIINIDEVCLVEIGEKDG